MRRVFGFVLSVAGCWLMWDLAATLSTRPVEMDGWRFCFPFFVACVDAGHWTLVADSAIALILIGVILAASPNGLRFNLQMPLRQLVKTFLFALCVGIALTYALIIVDPLKLLLG